jgi:multidrug efflux system membrane fusion protein
MDDQRSEIRLPERPARVDHDAISREYEEPVIPRQREAVSRPSRWRLLKRLLWLVLVAMIVAAAVWYFPRPDTQPKEAGRGRSGGPVPVGVVPVQKGDMPVSLSQLGTVSPLATVTVKTQINGYLTEVAFKEGQMVKKGDFLAQIDPRPYQVALEQAEATLAKDQALLKNAQLDLERYNTLVAQNSIARQTRDTQVSLVAQNQATIKSDQAQIDVQKLNLTYCRIVSPVTGRVGLRQVDPGNYVQTSDPNGIVVVTQLQPISVIFTVAEDNLPAVMKRVRAGASLPVSAFDRTGTTELGTGTLETVDNQIDTTTGTVKLRAVFNNREEILFPNQFVNVRLLVNTMQDTDIVPVSAIQRGAPGTFVYVVSPENTVTVAKVKLGPSDGQRIAILTGLQPGQSVVVDGADRLRDGAKVTLAPSKPEGAAPGDERNKGQPQAAAGQTGPQRADSEGAAGQRPAQPQGQQPGEGRGGERRRGAQ